MFPYLPKRPLTLTFRDLSQPLLCQVRGAKRVVLIDPAYEYACTQPESNLGACWSGIDILTDPPPHARTIILRRGDALLIPKAYWHAVENLEPTLAVGMNDYALKR